jgi:two-component system, LytTR family, sensor histidine kinase AlgZ
MHPILAHLRRLWLYLIASLPLAGMVAYLLHAAGGVAWLGATVLAAPLCLFYAFFCLSAWYPCRLMPLQGSKFFTLLLSHLAAALVASALWWFAAKAFAGVLSQFSAFEGLSQRLSLDFSLMFGTGILLYLLAVAFHYVLLAVEASQEAQARQMQAGVLAREAELKALKAQVNPHFLFNSLNSISALTSSDPAKARDMCVLLAEFLRKTLSLGEKAAIPLREEILLLDGYLAVEKVRFGARLRVEREIEEEAFDALVPPLLLQPLIENAVMHGIAHLPEGGWIRLSIRCDDRNLSVLVENSIDPEAPAMRSNGMGLANVRQRLDARYGELANFSAGSEGSRFQVGIVLPVERQVATS